MYIKVITLVGSTRFKDLFDEWNLKLTLEGNAVFSCGCWFQQKGDVGKNLPEVDHITKEMLDRIHKKKIEISDAIFVLNKNGYIGESTRSEIKYAKSLNKEIIYLESTPLMFEPPYCKCLSQMHPCQIIGGRARPNPDCKICQGTGRIEVVTAPDA